MAPSGDQTTTTTGKPTNWAVCKAGLTRQVNVKAHTALEALAQHWQLPADDLARGGSREINCPCKVRPLKGKVFITSIVTRPNGNLVVTYDVGKGKGNTLAAGTHTQVVKPAADCGKPKPPPKPRDFDPGGIGFVWQDGKLHGFLR